MSEECKKTSIGISISFTFYSFHYSNKRGALIDVTFFSNESANFFLGKSVKFAQRTGTSKEKYKTFQQRLLDVIKQYVG